MIYRTRFQRCQAACDLLRDLELRATNPITKEVCHIADILISAPAHERAAIETRAADLVKASERRQRLDASSTPQAKS